MAVTPKQPRTLTFGQEPTASDIYNLMNGIMVIKLNLFDLIQLKEFQTNMQEDIQAIDHSSINKFYKTIKETPCNLREGLVIPKMAKIYLTGTSFGGRTAVRHAELYPDTFDGYIPCGGVYATKYFSGHEYLSPFDFGIHDQKINKIRQPILLIHNYDDNRIPMEETLNLYRQLKTANKAVELCIIPKGNPIPTCGKLPLIMKGHLEPTEPEHFKKYVKTIKNFILNKNDSKRMALSEWTASQYEIYGYKNNKDASLHEKFLSESFRIYKIPYPGVNKIQMNFENDWVNLYEPLYCTLKFIDELIPKVTLENLNNIMDNIFNHPEFPEELNPLKSLDIFGIQSKGVKKLNSSDFYSSFIKFLKMIMSESNADLNVVKFFNLKDFNEIVGGDTIDKEINKIHELILEDSQIVANALRIQLPLLIQYLKERYKGGVHDPFPNFKCFDALPYEAESYVENKDLQDAFIGHMLNQNADLNFRLRFLECVYRGNPSLAKQFLVPENSNTQETLDEKEELLNIIKKDIKLENEYLGFSK